jgi:hypothetical protein
MTFPRAGRPQRSWIDATAPERGTPGEDVSAGKGAGDQLAIVLFSFRGTTGDMILYLDKTSNVSFRLGFPKFKATLAHQIATGAIAKLKGRAA